MSCFFKQSKIAHSYILKVKKNNSKIVTHVHWKSIRLVVNLDYWNKGYLWEIKDYILYK